MAASHGPGLSQVLVLLLLGEKQSGKTSAGNTILQKTAFHQKTTRSCRKQGTTCGVQQVAVVDTPGWESRSSTPRSVSRELGRAVALCRPEPDAILLVLPAACSFGPEQWGAMEAQLSRIRTPIWQRAMVLFTQGDRLGGLAIQDHIQHQGRTLRWLLERCGNRYQVLTNGPSASETQVTQLMEKIQRMVEANRRPREIRDRMYTQLRREVSLREDGRLRGRPEEVQLRTMQDGRPRGRLEEVQLRTMQDVQDGRLQQGTQAGPAGTHVSRGLPAASWGFRPALGLVLLGRRRSGKSSAGNVILDRHEFQVDVKTSRSSAGHGEVSGWPVTVVDTPGWSLFGLANPKQVRSELGRSRSLCPAGSRVAFLLAVPVGSFGEKDRRAAEENLALLGGDVWSRTVVLFTYGEQLRGRTLQRHLERSGQPLQQLLDRCGWRHQVLDSNTADRTQIHQLLELLQQMEQH